MGDPPGPAHATIPKSPQGNGPLEPPTKWEGGLARAAGPPPPNLNFSGAPPSRPTLRHVGEREAWQRVGQAAPPPTPVCPPRTSPRISAACAGLHGRS